MLCILIFVYVLLLLCMFRSGYSVSLCYSVYCLCVTVYCTTAIGCQPTAVNKYIIYTIISFFVSFEDGGRKVFRNNCNKLGS